METHNQNSGRAAWGTGRMAFKGRLPFIREQIESDCPLTLVYAQIKDSLAGMSYNGFTYHVRKHFARKGSRRSKTNEVTQPAAASTPVLTRAERAVAQRWSADDTKRRDPGQPSKFIPGPRVPNPKDLY